MPLKATHDGHSYRTPHICKYLSPVAWCAKFQNLLFVKNQKRPKKIFAIFFVARRKRFNVRLFFCKIFATHCCLKFAFNDFQPEQESQKRENLRFKIKPNHLSGFYFSFSLAKNKNETKKFWKKCFEISTENRWRVEWRIGFAIGRLELELTPGPTSDSHSLCVLLCNCASLLCSTIDTVALVLGTNQSATLECQQTML